MPATLSVSKLDFKPIPNGEHADVEFKFEDHDIGKHVSFDIVGPCKDILPHVPLITYCEPEIRIMNLDVSGYSNPHWFTPDMVVTFEVEGPVVNDSSPHCKNAKVTVKGYFHPKLTPVIHGTVQVGGALVGGTGSVTIAPDLVKDLEFEFCCSDCKEICRHLTDPVVPKKGE